MRILLILTIFALAACGVDGPPERPASKPGVSVSGDAYIGVETTL